MVRPMPESNNIVLPDLHQEILMSDTLQPMAISSSALKIAVVPG